MTRHEQAWHLFLTRDHVVKEVLKWTEIASEFFENFSGIPRLGVTETCSGVEIV